MTATAPIAVSRPIPDPEGLSFIEVQFPVSKLSKESYTERKANVGQTLTTLGKWWGRKPLVLVRAIVLGLLLPATDDPEADREVFLALMTMDDEGMLRRLRGAIPAKTVASSLPASEWAGTISVENGSYRWKRGTSSVTRERLQRRAFLAMSYDRRIEHCKRPEHIDGPSPEAWGRINDHLGTNATTLRELVQELSDRWFGHTPCIGDAFSGGGSIPFEAARIGCDAYASDLNPVAAILTWGALNIIGANESVVERVKEAQQQVYRQMREQVEEWGIERNEEGWVADAFLYCGEVRDPATGWWVPIAPSWIVGHGTKTIARLSPSSDQNRVKSPRFCKYPPSRLSPQSAAWATGAGTAGRRRSSQNGSMSR
jgi:putative DNA methylase